MTPADASRLGDARHVAEIIALLSGAAFFAYKAISGYLITNVSIKLRCVRQHIPGATDDHLKVTITLEKGDRGTVQIHDVQARVCTAIGKLPPIFETDFDSLGVDRRSFKHKSFGNTERAVINWDRLSQTSPFLNLSPGEKTDFSFLAKVPSGIPCMIYCCVLGRRRGSPRIAQWRASSVSLP